MLQNQLYITPFFHAFWNFSSNLPAVLKIYSFAGVPGRMGIPGNSKADYASNCTLNQSYHYSPFTDVKYWLNVLFLINDKKAEILKTITNCQSTNTSWPLKYPKKADVLLTKLRIGYSKIAHKGILLWADVSTLLL